MTDPDRLLSEFIDAWIAGDRPEAEAYIERAPADTRDALADDIASYLQVAPTPAYSAGVMDELVRDEAVVELAAAIQSRRGLWPELLPRLRREARLDRDELAARLVERLGVADDGRRTERYLERMEEGTLDPSRVSGRVLDALGRIFGVGSEVLASAGDFRLFSEPALSGAVLHGEEPGDELDRLFCGGRDALPRGE